jgi:hypothetical protein
MAGINKLRFLKRSNLQNAQKLQKEWFREIIQFYGIDTVYFRKYLDFYRDPSGSICDYVYGESPTSEYYLSGDMIVYMEMLGDSFLLSKFGIETDGDAAIYFTIEDFNQQFKDEIGVTVSGKFDDMVVSALVSGFDYNVSGTVSNSEISGFYSESLTTSASGNIIESIEVPVKILPPAVNDKLAFPNYYDYSDWDITGTLVGELKGFIGPSGTGILKGPVSGILTYNTKPAELRGPGWDKDIAPQVGDFFRIDFEDNNNYEEYEISRVSDRNLETDGLNPLLGKYIWKCDVVRRDPSYEDVIGDIQEENQTTSKIEQNTWEEDVSNEIFEYDNTEVDLIDVENSDAVYGDY